MKALNFICGLDNRFKCFIGAIPKPLLPIDQRAVLEIQIGNLKANDFDHIF